MYRRRLHFEELGKALVTHKFIAGSGFHELCCQLIFDRKFKAKNKEHHKAQCKKYQTKKVIKLTLKRNLRHGSI
ncbi:hypothetical protein T05_6630 [Trichinella murrelli]|uniref:Uncharacterized protein n=1 Tax=Trichinella murrelli TaxID=144512 RepID=A0A0V0UJ58_9BILA|nr:hypothetical protein T05_6630 [Trichinella murrelli]